MIIKVEIKKVYGLDKIYPVTFSNELNILTGAKTLSKRHINALKILGFEFEVVTKKIEL